MWLIYLVENKKNNFFFLKEIQFLPYKITFIIYFFILSRFHQISCTTRRHDITDIVLKVTLNTIPLHHKINLANGHLNNVHVTQKCEK